MTAEEFVVAYADRSNVPIAFLLAHRKVVVCHCDYEGCDGWGMVPFDADDQAVGLDATRLE